jgi:inorganic triphosphatase YgiF
MERELKFLLDYPHLPTLPAGYHLGTPQPTLHLLDEYVDDRGQIRGAGWRLRRRRSDGEAMRYTLKSARAAEETGPLSVRVEIERIPTEGEDIPVEIVAALTSGGVDVVRLGDRLQPYLTLRQERLSVALFNGGVEVALLSIDEVRAEAPTLAGEQRWSELEIEFLPTVATEICDRVAGDLSAWLMSQPDVSVGGEAKVDRAGRLLSISL